MEKPKKWTWEEVIRDESGRFSKELGKFSVDCFHANGPYIEWLESELEKANEGWFSESAKAGIEHEKNKNLEDRIAELEKDNSILNDALVTLNANIDNIVHNSGLAQKKLINRLREALEDILEIVNKPERDIATFLVYKAASKVLIECFGEEND